MHSYGVIGRGPVSVDAVCKPADLGCDDIPRLPSIQVPMSLPPLPASCTAEPAERTVRHVLLDRRLTALHAPTASNLKARVANRPYSQE